MPKVQGCVIFYVKLQKYESAKKKSQEERRILSFLYFFAALAIDIHTINQENRPFMFHCMLKIT